MVVAVLALMVALGGSAFAVTAAKNSVSTKSIRNEAVTSKKVKDGAVKSADIANGAVLGEKIAHEAVTTDKIKDNSINNADYSNESISSGKLEQGSLAASRFYRANNFTYDFPSVGGNSCTGVQPAGYEDLQAGDRVIVSTPASVPAPLTIRGSAEQGGVLFTLCNLSGAPVDPGSFSWKVLVIR